LGYVILFFLFLRGGDRLDELDFGRDVRGAVGFQHIVVPDLGFGGKLPAPRRPWILGLNFTGDKSPVVGTAFLSLKIRQVIFDEILE
jgi:hypothetical protein